MKFRCSIEKRQHNFKYTEIFSRMPSNTALWFYSLQIVQVLLSYSRNSLVHFIIVKSMTSLSCSGPDVVVCDEGHLLKNSKSGIRNAVVQIASKRRVVLTGTPLQNNLKECEYGTITIMTK